MHKASLMSAGSLDTEDSDYLEPLPEVVRDLNAAGWTVLKIGGSVLKVTPVGLVEVGDATPAEFVLVPT